MAGAVPRIDGQRRWRTPALIFASLVVHAALLGPLALRGIGVSMPPFLEVPERIVIPVDLERRPRLPEDAIASRPRGSAAPPTPADPVPPAPSTAESRLAGAPQADDAEFPSRPASQPTAPNLSAPPGADPWRATPDAQGARIARALRRGAAGCRAMAGRLDAADQAHCDQAFGAAVASAPAISGTGDPVRDARMATASAFALAEYDRRRAPLKPNSRAQAPAPSPDPGDPGAFAVSGRLWSSRDGWLPDLPRRQ